MVLPGMPVNQEKDEIMALLLFVAFVLAMIAVGLYLAALSTNIPYLH